MNFSLGITTAIVAYLTSIISTATAFESRDELPAGQGYGVGMHTCADFARSYSANPSGTEDVYFVWAQGFMSALNLSSQVANGVSMDLTWSDMATQKIQIRSYCDAHPLAQYVQAVLALYQTLPVLSR